MHILKIDVIYLKYNLYMSRYLKNTNSNIFLYHPQHFQNTKNPVNVINCNHNFYHKFIKINLKHKIRFYSFINIPYKDNFLNEDDNLYYVNRTLHNSKQNKKYTILVLTPEVQNYHVYATHLYKILQKYILMNEIDIEYSFRIDFKYQGRESISSIQGHYKLFNPLSDYSDFILLIKNHLMGGEVKIIASSILSFSIKWCNTDKQIISRFEHIHLSKNINLPKDLNMDDTIINNYRKILNKYNITFDYKCVQHINSEREFHSLQRVEYKNSYLSKIKNNTIKKYKYQPIHVFKSIIEKNNIKNTLFYYGWSEHAQHKTNIEFILTPNLILHSASTKQLYMILQNYLTNNIEINYYFKVGLKHTEESFSVLKPLDYYKIITQFTTYTQFISSISRFISKHPDWLSCPNTTTYLSFTSNWRCCENLAQKAISSFKNNYIVVKKNTTFCLNKTTLTIKLYKLFLNSIKIISAHIHLIDAGSCQKIELPKRPVGRPLGSPNKVKKIITIKVRRTGRPVGRPLGSTNKVKKIITIKVRRTGRPVGRPLGSTNKVKKIITIKVRRTGRPVGRPLGSTNKVKKT